MRQEKRDIEVKIDVRYLGQSYDLPILVDITDKHFWDKLPDNFHAAHAARFGHADPSNPIEIVGIGVTGIGRIDTPVLPKLAEGMSLPPPAALKGSRKIYFEPFNQLERGEFQDAPIYDRAALLAGNTICGPAVVEEISATTILYPGDRLTVHVSGNMIVEVAQ
ncbi:MULTISPECIES: hypothetical protein [unclassified Mesorhizobium]|uniref:hypothetical protein n=1 Tax=unclassified Mesorhizobium TaxID=325217 RepID=UPI0012296DEE|nr:MULTISPECIES: hypothetical protein [unclassified Mesorhizobium]TIX31718.1 MAG: hypothetical protein E5V37_11420 [Mesorhizobium sp.]